MAWAATARKNENSAGGVASLNVTLNSTVAGNHIFVATSYWKSGGNTSNAVSDGTNGAYSEAFHITNGDPSCSLHYFENGAGGNLTITANPSPDNSDVWVACHEFSGGATSSSLDGTPTTNSGTSATASTGNLVPANNDVLCLGVMDLDNSGNITENAGGEGFTLSNENQLFADIGQPGSFVYKIFSGAPGTVVETWTVPASSPWVAGIAAFKIPSVGGVTYPELERNIRGLNRGLA